MHIDFLKRNAENKIADARILFDAGSFSNAYYLGGYGIEIGLKACIALQFSANTIPDKKFINDIHTHEFTKLVRLAGLNFELKNAQDGDNIFGQNWGIVCQWSEETRYQTTDKYNCAVFLSAIEDVQHGVAAWIRKHW